MYRVYVRLRWERENGWSRGQAERTDQRKSALQVVRELGGGSQVLFNIGSSLAGTGRLDGKVFSPSEMLFRMLPSLLHNGRGPFDFSVLVVTFRGRSDRRRAEPFSRFSRFARLARLSRFLSGR